MHSISDVWQCHFQQIILRGCLDFVAGPNAGFQRSVLDKLKMKRGDTESGHPTGRNERHVRVNTYSRSKSVRT